MRILITILLSLLITGKVLAECSSGGIKVFPSTKEIKQSSRIILEGYASSQKVIELLNKDYPVYLESGNHQIKLKVLSINKGMYSLTQAILEPREKLLPGKTYFLKVDKLDDYQQGFLKKWDSEKKSYEPVSWIVGDKIDTSAPKLLATPRLVDKKTLPYGCGPAVYANFKLEAEDESDILVKTELVNITTGQKNIYYLNLHISGTLNVGHGMCSGAFSFRPQNFYKIRFNLTDNCGNSDNLWTDWIEFESPYEV